MTTENRRKEEQEAKMKEPRPNLLPPSNSAMVDKAEREESILPVNQRYIHIREDKTNNNSMLYE